MTTPTRPRATAPLWIAAAACALLGAVLLGPALLTDGPVRRARPPAAGALPAATAASGSAPAGTAPADTASASSGPQNPGEQNPSQQRPASGDSSVLADASAPAEPHDDEPVVPAVPPLPAKQGHGDVEAPAADPGQWRPVLTGFAEDFTDAGDGTSDWAARLARWTSPQLAASYRGVDDREIPTGRLIEITASDVGTFTLAFTARYDTGLVLHGQAAYGPTSWRVTAAEPGQASATG